MTILTLAAALALAVQPVLPRPDDRVAWETVVEDADGRILLDPASVRREGDLVRFHIRIIPAEGSKVAQFAQAIMAVVLDCRAHTSGFAAGQTYDRAGNLVQSRETPPDEVSMVAFDRDAAEERYHARVCPAR